MTGTRVFAATLLLLSSLSLSDGVTQEREDRTLLSWTQMRAIINEVSGERPMHTVLELVPYPRVRTRAEYEGASAKATSWTGSRRSTASSQRRNRDVSDAQRLWLASQGGTLDVKPEIRKLYDFNDVVITACPGSETGDVTAGSPWTSGRRPARGLCGQGRGRQDRSRLGREQPAAAARPCSNAAPSAC